MDGKSNSQKVFDEVGYNISEEAKELIRSLDRGRKAIGEMKDDIIRATEQQKDVTELEAAKKQLEREVEELKAENASLKEKIEELELEGLSDDKDNEG